MQQVVGGNTLTQRILTSTLVIGREVFVFMSKVHCVTMQDGQKDASGSQIYEEEVEYWVGEDESEGSY
jgi:hypothetical protein